MRGAACILAIALALVAVNGSDVDIELNTISEGATEASTSMTIAADSGIPTIPGLGMGCLAPRKKFNPWVARYYKRRNLNLVPTPKPPIAYAGQCVVEVACPQMRQVHGECAGIGVVCCRNEGVVMPTPSVLRAPAPSNDLARLIVIPSAINPGLAFPSAAFQLQKFGNPGCALDKSCFSCSCASSALVRRNVITENLTPTLRVRGLKPFVQALARAFAALKTAGARDPELLRVYNSAKSAGGLCCRPIKRSDGSAGGSYSNHSWGMAVDLFFGTGVDARGDGKTQFGLSKLYPFMAAERIYWGAGYGGSEEDAMHFEASQSLINEWVSRRLIV